MCILRALGDALFRPPTQQNWPWGRKLAQGCWCLHWFLALRADVWKTLLQRYTRPVVTKVWIQTFNKHIEIRFRSVVFHLYRWALVPSTRVGIAHSSKYCAMIEARTQRPLWARENRPSASSLITPVFSNITFNFEFYSILLDPISFLFGPSGP